MDFIGIGFAQEHESSQHHQPLDMMAIAGNQELRQPATGRLVRAWTIKPFQGAGVFREMGFNLLPGLEID